jgi:hypothetical protein
MRVWLRLIFIFGFALGGAVAAAPTGDAVRRASRPEVRAEVVAAINGQLTAFRAGDPARAYTFAAAELRAQKTLPAFSAIVRNSYPEIWANRRAEFGIVRDDGVRATVTVQVYGRETDAAYDYTLKKEAEGWRIFGVVRHEPKQAGKA